VVATAGGEAQAPGPGSSALGFDIPELTRRTLALEADRQSLGNVLTIRLPVRAEDVTVDKQAFVTEEVAVRPSRVDDVVRIEETIRREQLRVDTRGDVEIDERGLVDADRRPPDRATGPEHEDRPRRGPRVPDDSSGP